MGAKVDPKRIPNKIAGGCRKRVSAMQHPAFSIILVIVIESSDSSLVTSWRVLLRLFRVRHLLWLKLPIHRPDYCSAISRPRKSEQPCEAAYFFRISEI